MNSFFWPNLYFLKNWIAYLNWLLVDVFCWTSRLRLNFLETVQNGWIERWRFHRLLREENARMDVKNGGTNSISSSETSSCSWQWGWWSSCSSERDLDRNGHWRICVTVESIWVWNLRLQVYSDPAHSKL